MKIVSTLLIVFFIVSCTSSKVISFYVVDEQNIHFKTFSFYARDTEKLRPQEKTLDSLLEVSISSELIKKGFVRQNYSDVYVSYKILLGTATTSNVDRYSYYQNYYPNYDMYYPNYNITTTQYKEGVLLIELTTNDDKLLWQGSKSFRAGKSENTRNMLVQYAHEIVGAFKP